MKRKLQALAITKVNLFTWLVLMRQGAGSCNTGANAIPGDMDGGWEATVKGVGATWFLAKEACCWHAVLCLYSVHAQHRSGKPMSLHHENHLP